PPTNVVVHSATRLTFVTPPRAASATPYAIAISSNGFTLSTNFTYVARAHRAVPAARKPAFSYDGQFVAFESRYALVPADTNGEVDIYVRNRNTGALRRVSVSSTGGQ